MSSTEQGKKFMNSLQKYINSVKYTLLSLQEPFKVYETDGGLRMTIPSTNKECKEFAKKYGTNEISSSTSVDTPYGKCSYKSKTSFVWDPSKKTSVPDGFYLKNESKKNDTKDEIVPNIQLLSNKFNKDLLKYTNAFNQYNEQLINNNYATEG